MASDQTLSRQAGSPTSVAPTTDQDRRHTARTTADRIVLQVQSIDAWVSHRRERERALAVPGLSRDEQMDATREVEALRRTHDTIKGCCARALNADVAPMQISAPTAVVAHRHAWFVNHLALFLGGHGVTVLLATDNGAEALGAVVAEQPDIVLAGECLAMMPARAMLADARVYAPSALLALQASDPAQGAAHEAADRTFHGYQPPGDVADALVDLLTAPRDR